MITANKMMNMARTISLCKLACNTTCCLFKTIDEHSIDTIKLNAILNIVSGVKYHFAACICNVHYKLWVSLWNFETI